MNVDNSLVSQTLPESVEDKVQSVSSGLSNGSNFLPVKRDLKMACLNINSLDKHVYEFRVLLAEISIAILTMKVTKPNLTNLYKSSELHISGHEFIRRDRSRNGGRVDFNIKSSHSYAVRSDLNAINLEKLTNKIRKPK